MMEECEHLGGGDIVQCNWDELTNPQDLGCYIVNVTIRRKSYIAKSETNVIVLRGLRFNKSHEISVIHRDNQGHEKNKLTGQFGYSLSDLGVYKPEFMDNIAEAIARKLKSTGGKKQWDFSEELVEISQRWSYDVTRFMMVISNDADSFAGKEGFKRAPYRDPAPCKFVENSQVKCATVYLKEQHNHFYTFTWPEYIRYGPELSVQLRFFYEAGIDKWYATKVYSLDDTETSQSRNSESGSLGRIIQVFGCLSLSYQWPAFWLLE
ncbi:hypothetical protein Ciccas_013400 [Cichlidogyrus casuarinus]|uniref:Uncharacterized protein n=1 Tax=Cichlidogyrus casuarinus TaxID=1844966 RepID=A0ABD2PM60_9PLAT